MQAMLGADGKQRVKSGRDPAGARRAVHNRRRRSPRTGAAERSSPRSAMKACGQRQSVELDLGAAAARRGHPRRSSSRPSDTSIIAVRMRRKRLRPPRAGAPGGGRLDQRPGGVAALAQLRPGPPPNRRACRPPRAGRPACRRCATGAAPGLPDRGQAEHARRAGGSAMVSPPSSGRPKLSQAASTPSRKPTSQSPSPAGSATASARAGSRPWRRGRTD